MARGGHGDRALSSFSNVCVNRMRWRESVYFDEESNVGRYYRQWNTAGD